MTRSSFRLVKSFAFLSGWLVDKCINFRLVCSIDRSIIITHPLIFARFYWLLYVTWSKFTGRSSRNNPRLRRYLPSYYFPLKSNKASGKKPAQEFHLFIFIILHGRKTNSFCRSPVIFTAKSWSQMPFRKLQKCQQNMLSTSLKV